MKNYTTPEIIKIELESEEIICASGVSFGGDQAGDIKGIFDDLFKL